jgi:DNA replication and repair protein RecF
LITELRLYHYKNYKEGHFTFSGRLNFIVGKNGIGKTNLLDAVYYLCMARSHSTPKDRDTLEFGQSFFRLEADLRRDESSHRVIIKVQPGRLKEITVDGKPVNKLSEYVGFIPVVMLAPEDVAVIRGGGALRRRFLDLCICQFDHNYLDHLQRYQRLLTQRNTVLRRDGIRADRSLLGSYSAAMMKPAKYLAEARSRLIEDVRPKVLELYTRLSNEAESPSLRYQSQLLDNPFDSIAAGSMDADMKTGHTTCGVHRDDLIIMLDGKPAKQFGSQGQVKSLLVALDLAQAMVLRRHTGKSPILLLDDIFDRLDDERSLRLVNMIAESGFGQAFVTDASPDQMRLLTASLGHAAGMFELSQSSAVWHRKQEIDNLHH